MSSGHNNKPVAADRIKNEPESVWVEFIQLALENKPLNLGQGFPDFAAPQYLIDSLHNATDQKGGNHSLLLNNQYTRSFGHPRLVKALQTYYSEFRGFDKLSNANEQILVTVGAYEALFTSVMAFVNPGDEVIIIEPAFDAYEPMVRMAHGKAVFIPLREMKKPGNISSSRIDSSNFALDMDEFKRKVSPRTRMLVLNTPNNPLGKVYSLSELQEIASICIENNILVLADEVYEQMYYPGQEHLSMAKLPGMWDRTITIGSAGKTFSVTGWKLGWALGPKELIRFLQLVHQTAVYTVATPLQEASARMMEHEMETLRSKALGYWDMLRQDLLSSRQRMANILERAQMRPIVPQGGYFMLADFSSLAKLFPEYYEEGERPQTSGQFVANTNDYRFARWLSKAKKLQVIPGSAFYSDETKPLASNLLRFCFIKEKATLDKLEILLEMLMKDKRERSKL